MWSLSEDFLHQPIQFRGGCLIEPCLFLGPKNRIAGAGVPLSTSAMSLALRNGNRGLALVLYPARFRPASLSSASWSPYELVGILKVATSYVDLAVLNSDDLAEFGDLISASWGVKQVDYLYLHPVSVLFRSPLRRNWESCMREPT